MAIPIPAQSPHPCESPVFILTASRSGSTLLRFILDSHPELACPPETSIASVCAGLARTWDILDTAASGTGRPVHEAAPLPLHAALGIRAAIDRVYEHYLRLRGKRRWCDKSLDSFQYAGLITEVYPDAKFICLYRHCMDVIASGVEACPWGVHRFGFDQFVAQFPGNSVAAIGGYWLNVCETILAFEQQRPGMCHRVRYEDLVTAPEQTAAELFSFLGIAQVPGITSECFRTPHESGGPGDEKIWFTAGVTPDSIGRGVSVPVGGFPPPLLNAVNDVLDQLGYRTVDARWNALPSGVDPRRGSAPGPDAADGTGDGPDAGAVSVLDALRSRIQAGDLAAVVRQWPAVDGSCVMLVAESEGTGGHAQMRLRFDSAVTTAATAAATAAAAAGSGGEEPIATFIAGTVTWLSLLDGSANPVTEITSGRLRCVNKRDDHRIRSDEVHALATLLGFATIPTALP